MDDRMEAAKRRMQHLLAASDALVAAVNAHVGDAPDQSSARRLATVACAAKELASRLSGKCAALGKPTPAELAIDSTGQSGLWRLTVSPIVRDVLEAAEEVFHPPSNDADTDAQFVVESFAAELDAMRQAPGFSEADVHILASAIASTYVPSEGTSEV